MPFTISHAAAALPLHRLHRSRLRFAALAIGCASPDFEFFFHLNATGRFGHTLAGVVMICLPVSWFALWLWDLYGRAGFESLLPNGWCLPPRPQPTTMLWTTFAILLGTASHLFWDGFTHASDWGVRLLPVLKTTVAIAGVTVPWFKVLQHLSTLFGLAVLGIVALRWARTQSAVPPRELATRLVVPAVFVGAAATVNGLRFLDSGLQSFVVAASVAGMLAMGVGVVLAGALRRPAVPPS